MTSSSPHKGLKQVQELVLTPHVSLAILKSRVEELGSETKKKMIDMIITAWESIQMSLMNKPADSMPERLGKVMRNEGGHDSY
jgi:hypothetical protein